MMNISPTPIEEPSPTRFIDLLELVRFGVEPNAFHRINDLLTCCRTLVEKQLLMKPFDVYTEAFTVLLETIYDKTIDASWRMYCLDFMYIPIREMGRFATDPRQKRLVEEASLTLSNIKPEHLKSDNTENIL